MTRTWQAHGLAGPYRQVGMDLFGLPRSVVAAPWYLLLFDIGTRAGVHLFTRLEDEPDRLVCHEATLPGLGDLPAAVLRAAGSAGGPEPVLRARCALSSSAPSIAPISPRGAFGRPYDSLRGSWARALVLAR